MDTKIPCTLPGSMLTGPEPYRTSGKAFPRAVILFPIADKRLRLREEGAGNSLKRYLIFPILKGLRAGGSALHALIAAEQHKQGDCGIAAPGGQHAVHIRRV